MQPKVSILVPTYNVEPYLVQCMDSIINQTLQEIEVICVNDGSTDRSLEILKRYAQKDNRIIIIDKENGGYGVGMNIASECATGEYIGIVEPDDYISPQMYEDLYKKAKENELDFIKADFYRFAKDEENGDIVYTYNHLSKEEEDYNVVFNPSETPSALRFIMNTWSGIYKREFLLEHHIVYNETPGASFQDNGFWFQTFVFAKRAMIVNTPYYRNRRDNPNSSVKNPEKVYAMNVEYDHIRSILVKYPEVWDRFRGMFWVKKYHNYVATMRRIADEFHMEFMERFETEFRWAQKRGELQEDAFNPAEWDAVCLLINSWKKYYALRLEPDKVMKKEFVRLEMTKERLEVRLEKIKEKYELEKAKRISAEKKLKKIMNSRSFKLGKLLTAIPRKIRGAFRRKK